MSKPEKTFTNSYKIKRIMHDAFVSKKPTQFPELYDKSGRILPRSSISMYVNKIQNDEYDGVYFYTMTDANGILFIGVR